MVLSKFDPLTSFIYKPSIFSSFSVPVPFTIKQDTIWLAQLKRKVQTRTCYYGLTGWIAIMLNIYTMGHILPEMLFTPVDSDVSVIHLSKQSVLSVNIIMSLL